MSILPLPSLLVYFFFPRLFPHAFDRAPIPFRVRPRMRDMRAVFKLFHPDVGHAGLDLCLRGVAFDVFRGDEFVDWGVEVEARDGRERGGRVEIGRNASESAWLLADTGQMGAKRISQPKKNRRWCSRECSAVCKDSHAPESEGTVHERDGRYGRVLDDGIPDPRREGSDRRLQGRQPGTRIKDERPRRDPPSRRRRHPRRRSATEELLIQFL